MKSKRRITFRQVFGIALFTVGFVTAVYPFVMSHFKAIQMNEEISTFEQYVEEVKKSDNGDEKDVLGSLYNELTEYNQRLINNGQEISCSDDFEEFDIDITTYGFDDNIIGVIDIPKIDQRLPLYLGASKQNMADGATVLGATSAPIGGLSTNCVIAGHRGSITGTKFRYINKLEIGDKVYIENPWETLTYEVVSTAVSSPSDVSQIVIRQNKDMITLFSCHPYPQNYQRYFVFCERITE